MSFSALLIHRDGDFRAIQIENDNPRGAGPLVEFCESWPSDFFWRRCVDENTEQFRSRAIGQARASGETTVIFGRSEFVEEDE
jgi:hypothetical protein